VPSNPAELHAWQQIPVFSCQAETAKDSLATTKRICLRAPQTIGEEAYRKRIAPIIGCWRVARIHGAWLPSSLQRPATQLVGHADDRRLVSREQAVALSTAPSAPCPSSRRPSAFLAPLRAVTR